MLKRSLEGILSEDEVSELYAAFDQIGDIIVVKIPDSLLSKKDIIGKTLLEEVKSANSVFYQADAVKGDYRTRKLEFLAGENKTETEYKEFGCRFKIDVEKAFFSPRLSTERERIANLIKEGEIVINMFGGVGMFSIMATKKNSCTVYNIDINPVASKLCEKNILINKLKGNVISINGDTSAVIKNKLKEVGDRTLMLLPESSDKFLNSAIEATKDKGIIHYYSHVHADIKQDAPNLSEEHYRQISPTECVILGSKIVRAVGPRYYQTVVDVKIKK